MPCCRHTSATVCPASASRRMPRICSSLNRLLRIACSSSRSRPSTRESRTSTGDLSGAQVRGGAMNEEETIMHMVVQVLGADGITVTMELGQMLGLQRLLQAEEEQ